MLLTEPDIAQQDWQRVAFRALGTDCQIVFRASSMKQGRAYREQAIAWVQDFEAKYSRFREDSLISRINCSAGLEWVEIDDELASIFALCDEYHWSTGGVFDPTMLPLARLWDYKAAHPTVPSEAEVQQALSLLGWQRVQRRDRAVFLPEPGMAIDLGGIGKEYAVDRVVEQAAAFGIADLMVDFGRDVRVTGKARTGEPWRVGLEDPRDLGQCWAGVLVTNRAVATSGDYCRGFEHGGTFYSHILDPRSGWPIKTGCGSATVIAPTCTEAGILSTAALILGADEGVKLMSRYPLAAGCVWQGDSLIETAHFHRYVLP
jgi:thiamine biosynthesis lipoprotein